MTTARPDFLVVGAARSGTTGLVEGLRTHPQIFLTQPKEPHYFAFHGTTPDFQAPGDSHTVNRVSVTDETAYRSLYQDAPAGATRGEGSVSSLYYHEQAVPEILRFNPQMRIVVMLREPVDRAFSSHAYLRVRGFEPVESFSEALALEPQRREHNYHHLWHYTGMSFYAKSLEHYFDAFGSDRVGVWFFDDLESDYEGTVSEVLRFLGVPPVPGEATGVPRVNKSGSPRSATLHKVIWAATRSERLRRAVKRTTSFRMREFVRRHALRSTGVAGEVRVRLAPTFEEDLKRTADLLRRHKPELAFPPWLNRSGNLDSTA